MLAISIIILAPEKVKRNLFVAAFQRHDEVVILAHFAFAPKWELFVRQLEGKGDSVFGEKVGGLFVVVGHGDIIQVNFGGASCFF